MQFSWFLTVSIGIKSNYETCISGINLTVTPHKLCTKIYVIVPITLHKRHNLYFIWLSTLLVRPWGGRERYICVCACYCVKMFSEWIGTIIRWSQIFARSFSVECRRLNAFALAKLPSICTCIRTYFKYLHALDSQYDGFVRCHHHHLHRSF